MLQKPNRINLLSLSLFFLFFYPSICSSATLRDVYEAAVDAYNKGNYEQSIQLYKQITKDMPGFAPAYIGLGLSLKAQGADRDEVIYYYKLAVEKDPKNVQALDQLGRLYYSEGMMEKSKATFVKLIKLDPNAMSAKLTLGWIDLMGKRTYPEEAIKYLEEVVKKAPSPNAYFGLGIAYFTANQREKALDIITKLKDMGQDDYANKLEKSVRENRKILTNNNMSDDPQDEDPVEYEITPDTPKGVKARLRGKLE